MPRGVNPDHPRVVALVGALQAAGVSAFQLADRMGVKPQSVTQILGGRRVPSLDWLAEASRHIGCAPSALDPWLADQVPAEVPPPTSVRVRVIRRGMRIGGRANVLGEVVEVAPALAARLVGWGRVEVVAPGADRPDVPGLEKTNPISQKNARD